MEDILETIREVNETTPLILKYNQNSNHWVKHVKTWILGLGSVTVAMITSISVAVINNWKNSNIFSFKKGINDFIQKPVLWIVPELSTTLLTTLAYKANEKIARDFFNKQISKSSKFKSVIKNQLWSLFFFYQLMKLLKK